MATEKKKSIHDKALEDQAEDQTLADQFLKEQELASLHAVVSRLINERFILAKGMDAVVSSWTLLKEEGIGTAPGATDAIERVATQAIGLANRVLDAFIAGQPTTGKAKK